MTDINGRHSEGVVPYKYWLPTEGLDTHSVCDLDEFEREFSDPSKTDRDKRIYFKDKVIVKHGEIYYNNNRNVKYWACFVSKRQYWKKISMWNDLISQELIDDDDAIEKRSETIHKSGIYTSVKGMPTGITIEPPNSGKTGYWPNFFMIIEDSNLKFDIGRKAINRNMRNTYQKITKEVFNDFSKYVNKYIAGEVENNPNVNWNRDTLINEINGMAKLESNLINFKKLPTNQEASVAAIFFELIGANKIKDIEPIITGHKFKYDLYAMWKNHFIIIEFKTHLRNILKDVTDETKYFSEIDYIICWDISSDDFEAFARQGYSLNEINNSMLSNPDELNYMSISTHSLAINGIKTVYIIDLKKILNQLEQE